MNGSRRTRERGYTAAQPPATRAKECGTCHGYGRVLVTRSVAEVDAGRMPFYMADCPAPACAYRERAEVGAADEGAAAAAVPASPAK